jgi:hypothetical protein
MICSSVYRFALSAPTWADSTPEPYYSRVSPQHYFAPGGGEDLAKTAQSGGLLFSKSTAPITSVSSFSPRYADKRGDTVIGAVGASGGTVDKDQAETHECAGPLLRIPEHDDVGRTYDRLGMGCYGRESKPLVEARISTIDRLQITIDARVVGFSEGRFDQVLADTLALGRASRRQWTDTPRLCLVYRRFCRQQPHCGADSLITPHDEAAHPSALCQPDSLRSNRRYTSGE